MTKHRIYTLQRRQLVPQSLRIVFDFFRDPNNLEVITPEWLHFKILSASDNPVREGTRIRYRLRWKIFPMVWESVITEYREGEYFSDEMLIGPYRRWYHRHRFRETGDGVEILDRVEYSLPLGLLGRLVHRALVRRQLEAIFDYREARIAERFGTPGPGDAEVDSGLHLILFAHGSNDPRWREPFDEILDRLASRFGSRVQLAFLERSKPSLEEAIHEASRKGADRVRILPLFLSAGQHIRSDLPRLAAEGNQAHPSLAIEVLSPVGDDVRFTDLLEACAQEALSTIATE